MFSIAGGKIGFGTMIDGCSGSGSGTGITISGKVIFSGYLGMVGITNGGVCSS
jgi:hypothetical protein